LTVVAIWNKLKQGMEANMSKLTAVNTVAIPKEEYQFLKELYKTVKRQQFLFRLDEAEKNLKAGKVKKVTVDKFIANI
jgi:hypothetical protein